MVGRDYSSLYMQLTVCAIKLEPLEAWQKANSVLGLFQPRQVPEVMGLRAFETSPPGGSSSLPIRVVAP